MIPGKLVVYKEAKATESVLDYRPDKLAGILAGILAEKLEGILIGKLL